MNDINLFYPFSSSNELRIVSIEEIGASEFSFIDEKKILYFTLSNYQKFLSDGYNIYDVSHYYNVYKFFMMEGAPCAVVGDPCSSSIFVVNLKTKEKLFQDDEAQNPSKNDEKTLLVTMKGSEKESEKGSERKNLYSIETKRLFSSPSDYDFYKKISESFEPLYVFKKYYGDYKSIYISEICILNEAGQVVFDKIVGDVDFYNDCMIITRCIDSFDDLGENNDGHHKKENLEIEIRHLDAKRNVDNKFIINKSRMPEILMNPVYYDGMIILIVKGAIEFHDLSHNLINELKVPKLAFVTSYKKLGNILEICYSWDDSNENNQHLFIDLKSRKSISDYRLEGYEGGNPTFFVGRKPYTESVKGDKSIFTFYNTDFDKTCTVKGNSCSCLSCDFPYLFCVKEKKDNSEQESILINAKTGDIKRTNHSAITFPLNSYQGYGINNDTSMVDVFDNELNVIASVNSDLFGLVFDQTKVFVNNEYVGINAVVPVESNTYRCAYIQNRDGKTIFSNFPASLLMIGNFFCIKEGSSYQFFNTRTGKMQQLILNLPTNEYGFVDFENLNLNDILNACDPISSKGYMNLVKKDKNFS